MVSGKKTLTKSQVRGRRALRRMNAAIGDALNDPRILPPFEGERERSLVPTEKNSSSPPTSSPLSPRELLKTIPTLKTSFLQKTPKPS